MRDCLIRSQARSGGVLLVSALLVAGCTHAGNEGAVFLVADIEGNEFCLVRYV
jgi:hypothetical protein